MTAPLLFLIIALQSLFVAGAGLKRWSNDTANLVTVKDGEFHYNGSLYRFYGTNAYWLQMTSDADMDRTLHDIASRAYPVVRTWAFNDVAAKPASGTYFQILNGGKATINDGPDGLQRLDKVVATANKYELKLVLSLTNNWNPDRPEPAIAFRPRNDDDTLPRGYLSNDYGGMDRYNRAFGSNPSHDDFYTKPEIITAFKNYLSHVVPRYINNPAILAWELGNDLRCSSTIPKSSSCNTTTITKWVADISSYIKSLDPSHLVTAGDSGFYCEGCPKLYAPSTLKLHDSPVGPAFDGSYGVDTEDIISVPSIDFGSFQLFPDQVQYFSGASTVDFAITAALQGGGWVKRHSDTATTSGKPEALIAFGIVTKDHWPFFVPFNSSKRTEDEDCRGVDVFQQNYLFVAWASVAVQGNVGGALEYLWLERGLDDVPHVASKRQLTGSTSPQDGSGHYPDGYTGGNAASFFGSMMTPH